ncbi:BadF/BadG/BcrA/BcrD ATPase family protein [uncultured Sulfitobacter sp.]|uniref:BadF/BadG/BcrA/BcrD ATPase family protein n=1 Tax=uncultured Sulfitobacter sp. TaxID=191468 RepID=UPI0030DA5D45|tara:strand:- start:25432 stop:26307 length:876 start_codon:yes stop_codon:yes gene_type:complete
MMDQHPPLIIGVDGGGTGCRVVVGTAQDGILAEATGGRANVSTNFEEAITHILEATHAAVKDAGQDAVQINHAVAHLGLAGFTGPDIGKRIADALPFGKSVVTEDTTTTIVGAIGAEDGYVLALGTGTIIARQREQAQTCIGGWCYQVSDQASGAWLGHGALEQTLLAVDGIVPASPLSDRMLAKFGGAAGIVQFSLKARPGDFGTLAPDVVETAAAGDPIGRLLMQRGADYLQNALAALEYQTNDLLCLAGGVGPHYAPYLPGQMTANLAPAKGRAVDGAFTLAKSAAAQ